MYYVFVAKWTGSDGTEFMIPKCWDDRLQKRLRLRRFKSDRDEIW